MKAHHGRETRKTNDEIYTAILKAKGEIDTIREDRNLDDNHDLSHASDHLDSFLNALEEQAKRFRDG